VESAEPESRGRVDEPILPGLDRLRLSAAPGAGAGLSARRSNRWRMHYGIAPPSGVPLFLGAHRKHLIHTSSDRLRLCGAPLRFCGDILDARLEDGSRVAAKLPPCAVDGPTQTVRKFTQRFTLDDLIAVGTLTAPLPNHLRAAVETRHNILISGGTGTGKTTLRNAVAQTIPPQDRIVLIEETSEIRIDKPNLVRFRGATGAGAAWPGRADARRDYRPLGAGHTSPSSRSDPRRGGSWSGSVRPLAGAQHRPSRKHDDDPCEQRRTSADKARALCADCERRTATSEHAGCLPSRWRSIWSST
jgi:hypothetical protein